MRFQQHETFFTQEVLTWAEEKYRLPSSTKTRVVFGFSNGGSFSATMGIRHPELFGSVIACAIAGDRYDLSKSPKLTNEFFLVSGTWDARFHSNVEYLHKTLRKAKVKCKLALRAADHDGKMWQEEFVLAMKAITK
jgi:enterochelin esterase-like enzyme